MRALSIALMTALSLPSILLASDHSAYGATETPQLDTDQFGLIREALPPDVDFEEDLSPEELETLLEQLEAARYTGEDLAFIDLYSIFESLGISIPVLGSQSGTFDRLFRGVISHHLLRILEGVIQDQIPIVFDPTQRYPLVETLPGGRFNANLDIEQWYAQPLPQGSWLRVETQAAVAQEVIEVLPLDEDVEAVAQQVVPEVLDLINAEDTDSENDAESLAYLMQAVGTLPTRNEGTIELLPGDYAIPLSAFCLVSGSQRTSPLAHRYVLTPLLGDRADILIAVNAKAVDLTTTLAQNDDADLLPDELEPQTLEETLQKLTASIQAGIAYEEMQPSVQRLVDNLIPEYHDRLSRSFLAELEASYNQFTSSIDASAEFPSFTEVLENLGPIGPIVRDYQALRTTLQRHGDDYDSLIRNTVESNIEIAAFRTPPEGEGLNLTPWSVISDRVYARMIAVDSCAHPTLASRASLQIRVVPDPLTTVAIPAVVPITGLVADPRDESILPIIGIPLLPGQ